MVDAELGRGRIEGLLLDYEVDSRVLNENQLNLLARYLGPQLRSLIDLERTIATTTIAKSCDSLTEDKAQKLNELIRDKLQTIYDEIDRNYFDSYRVQTTIGVARSFASLLCDLDWSTEDAKKQITRSINYCLLRGIIDSQERLREAHPNGLPKVTEAYRLMLGVDEIPKTTHNLPHNFYLPPKAFGDAEVQIYNTLSDNKERFQNVRYKNASFRRGAKVRGGYNRVLNLDGTDLLCPF